MSETLKTNTALTSLYLWSEEEGGKEKEKERNEE